MAESGLALVNLTNQDSFVFQFFPNEDRSTDRANWDPQETTIGIKPLFYGNREPRLIEFRGLYLDNTETGESLTPEIRKVQDLLEETEDGGTPPPLLAIWGDRSERCVLQDLTIETVLFDTEGQPIRTRMEISLLQLQPEGETTRVRVAPE
jgi:hypothetical protein